MSDLAAVVQMTGAIAKCAVTEPHDEAQIMTTMGEIEPSAFPRRHQWTLEQLKSVFYLSDERLLIASHIVPWSEDRANRLNPSNGLCLTAIPDKAFDRHLFSLTDNSRVILSEGLKTTKIPSCAKYFG